MKLTSARKTLYTLAFALVVVTLGYGIVIPVFPFLIDGLGGGGREMGLLIALAAFTELLFGPVWGGISDRLGRKRVLMVGIGGYAVSLAAMGMANSMGMLILARALSGVLTAATTPSAMAYVGETTSEDDRGGGIGVLGAASGLGIILGPGVGGWLGGASLSLPFYVGAGLAVVALVLVAALLPELTRAEPAVQRRPERPKPLPGVGEGPRRLWQQVVGPGARSLVLLFVASLGLANFEAVYGLYAANRFGFGPERVGTILVVMGVVTTLGKGLLTGPVTKRWGDRAVAEASMVAGAAGYLVLLAAFDYPTVLLATGLFILSKTTLRPALLAQLSKETVGGLGKTMGIGNTAVSMARVIGPIWAGFAFDLDARLPYLTGAGVLALGFVMSLLWHQRTKRR